MKRVVVYGTMSRAGVGSLFPIDSFDSMEEASSFVDREIETVGAVCIIGRQGEARVFTQTYIIAYLHEN